MRPPLSRSFVVAIISAFGVVSASAQTRASVLCPPQTPDRVLFQEPATINVSGRIPCGEQVEVIGSYGATYQVRRANGEVGYLMADAVHSPTSPKTSNSPSPSRRKQAAAVPAPTGNVGYANCLDGLHTLFVWPDGKPMEKDTTVACGEKLRVLGPASQAGYKSIRTKDNVEGMLPDRFISATPTKSVTVPKPAAKPAAGIAAAAVAGMLIYGMVKCSDCFAVGGNTPNGAPGQKTMLFGGLEHRAYLGCLSCSEDASDSVFNETGRNGSRYSTESIWNHFGKYGSPYSQFSACNSYATDAPVIVDQSGNA
jgi:hypothetical protein